MSPKNSGFPVRVGGGETSPRGKCGPTGLPSESILDDCAEWDFSLCLSAPVGPQNFPLIGEAARF